MGLDYADEDEDDYDFFGYDERYYPRPPWIWPSGIESHAQVPTLRAALLAKGFRPPRSTESWARTSCVCSPRPGAIDRPCLGS